MPPPSEGEGPASGPPAISSGRALRAALPADHLLVLKTHPESRSCGHRDRRVRPRHRPDDRAQRPPHGHGHADHRLLVVDLRVGAPAPAAGPARPRPGCLRGGSRVVPRLSDRDDRCPGPRHRRGRRLPCSRRRSTRPPRTPSSSASSGPGSGAPANVSSSGSSGRAGWSTSEVVPFRAMSATSEVPAAFRNTAGDPGALRWSVKASTTSCRDVGSSATSSWRTCASAAPTPCSAISGGCSTPSSRWSSTSSS